MLGLPPSNAWLRYGLRVRPSGLRSRGAGSNREGLGAGGDSRSAAEGSEAFGLVAGNRVGDCRAAGRRESGGNVAFNGDRGVGCAWRSAGGLASVPGRRPGPGLVRVDGRAACGGRLPHWAQGPDGGLCSADASQG